MPTDDKAVKPGLGKPIAFRLSEEDRADYLQKVAASGLTQSEFFRQAILAKKAEPVVSTGFSHDYASALFVLNMVNNKLNAVAKTAFDSRTNQLIFESAYDEVLDQLDAISRYLRLTLPNAS